MESFGFNVEDDATNNWITSHSENVMGFSSWGTHAEDGNCDFNDSAWVKDSLNFNLSNGAVFNSYESYNGTSLSTLVWRWINPNDPNNPCNHTQGLATQWTEIGGTGFTANAWEPTLYGAMDNRKTFNTYAMGYSMVDAFYQGINYLAWQNIVVGDPLTTIAWGKQSLSEDVTFKGSNLVTGEITVPIGNTIYLNDSAVINLKHDGFITGDGLIVSDSAYTVIVSDWDKSVLRSKNGNYVKLIWGDHPSYIVDSFYIYKKYQSPSFSLIGVVDDKTFEYTDATVTIVIPQTEPETAEYYVVAKSTSAQTDQSNTVSYYVGVDDYDKKIARDLNSVYEFNLAQNYPNPFNPTTIIKYEIPSDGLVTLKVYDILGNEIVTLVNEQKTAGRYEALLDARNLANGVYIYRIQVNDFVLSKKMILLR